MSEFRIETLRLILANGAKRISIRSMASVPTPSSWKHSGR